MAELTLTNVRSKDSADKIEVLPVRKESRIWNWFSGICAALYSDLRAGAKTWDEYDEHLLHK